jgi:hypothetical protein
MFILSVTAPLRDFILPCDLVENPSGIHALFNTGPTPLNKFFAGAGNKGTTT